MRVLRVRFNEISGNSIYSRSLELSGNSPGVVVYENYDPNPTVVLKVNVADSDGSVRFLVGRLMLSLVSVRDYSLKEGIGEVLIPPMDEILVEMIKIIFNNTNIKIKQC